MSLQHLWIPKVEIALRTVANTKFLNGKIDKYDRERFFAGIAWEKIKRENTELPQEEGQQESVKVRLSFPTLDFGLRVYRTRMIQAGQAMGIQAGEGVSFKFIKAKEVFEKLGKDYEEDGSQCSSIIEIGVVSHDQETRPTRSSKNQRAYTPLS